MFWQHLTFPTLLSRLELICSTFFKKKVLVQSSPLFQFIQLAEAHYYNLRASNKLVPVNVGPIVLEIRLFRLLQYNIMNN